MLKNIIANIIGRFWSILSNYIFIPLYISFLGIENYAVISFSLIIIGIMSVMDAGLSATLSREFAKSGHELVENYKIKVLNTLEVCYWFLVLLIILIVYFAAGPITNNWMTLNSLSPEYVRDALRVFGIVVAFQLLGNFYLGGLIGLEKQVKANMYQIVWGIFKNGLVLIVIFYKPSLEYFFAWQATITILYVFALRYDLGKTINNFPKSAFIFDKKILKQVRKFVAGMLLISIVAAVNTQLDKIAISKLLPIEELGYYNLANSLALSLVVLVTPIAIALLPRFTNLYSLGKKEESYSLYKKFVLIVSIIVFSIAANIMFNAKGLIWAWTGNIELSNASASYVFFLTLGTSLLAMQVIPFNIAIANGYTKINNVMGISSLFISIPSYWLSVQYFGSQGAAITWCVIQSVSTPIYLYLIQRKFLDANDFMIIFFKRILLPALISIALVYGFSLINIEINGRLNQIIYIGLSTFVTLTIVSLICFEKKQINEFKFFIIEKLVTIKNLRK